MFTKIESTFLGDSDKASGWTQAFFVTMYLPNESVKMARLPDCDKSTIEQSAIQMMMADGLLEYQAKRALEYPSIGDQLDALWKGGQDQSEMQAKVQAVKLKYPKV